MEKIIFTFELVKKFNAKAIESSLQTQDILYLVDKGRLAELKADVCRYILQILQDIEAGDNSYFLWNSSEVNKRLEELYNLGCDGAIEKFFQFGYWT